MKKQLSTKSQLLKRLAFQENEILALRSEVAKLKKSSLSNENEIYPVNEILTLMPGSIFWKDKSGKLLGCNDNNAKFFGFTSYKDMIGMYSKDFMPEEYARLVDK